MTHQLLINVETNVYNILRLMTLSLNLFTRCVLTSSWRKKEQEFWWVFFSFKMCKKEKGKNRCKNSEHLRFKLSNTLS